MKHLKKYNEADLASDKYKQQELLRTLEDMSLELWDENFNVGVGYDDFRGIITVSIEKMRHIYSPLGDYGAPRFDYNKIKDTFLSMISYMEAEGYSIGSIDVSEKYVADLIPVQLKEEELYSKYKQTGVNYPIGKLIIKFLVVNQV